MVGIGFAAGLAEGLHHTADIIARKVEQRKELDAQLNLHAQELQMRQLQVNTPERIASGMDMMRIDMSTGSPNVLIAKPTPEEMQSAQAQLMQEQQLKLSLQQPIKQEQSDAIAGALLSLTETKDVMNQVPIKGMNFSVPGKEETPVFSQQEATGLSKGLVQGGSGAAAISNIISSKASGDSKYQRQLALKQLEIQGKQVSNYDKQQADMSRLNKEYELKAGLQKQKFEHEFDVLGFKYDQEMDSIKLKAETRKSIMDYSQKAGLTTAQAAKILLEVEGDPFTLRQINRQLSESGQKPITAEDRARDLIERAKSFKESQTPEEHAKQTGDLEDDKQKKLNELLKKNKK